MSKGLHKDSLRKVDNPHQWMIDDARMELIQQIKAEVDRQAKSIDTATGDFAEGRRMEQRIILSFLSDLEKSEKPIEGLEEEIREFVEQEWDGLHDNDGNPLYTADYLEYIARHFARWGAGHRGSSEIPNDLEEAADEYAGEPDGFIDMTAYRAFIAGAKWQKEKLMKEAIHYVVQDDLDSHGASYNIPFIRIGTIALKPKGIGVGDKVRIIIVKED